MTHADQGHYAKKHQADRKTNPELVSAIKERLVDGHMPCAVAFGIAGDLNLSPEDVGFTLDILEIRIVKCQLGLYGYQPNKKIVAPAKQVYPELEEAIRKALVTDRLPCRAAWNIADRLSLGKMDVSSASEALKIKITPCQLGAF